jgi:hypothetical protein
MTGDNDLKKIRALGGTELKEQVKKLEVGSFIYYNGNTTNRLSIIPELRKTKTVQATTQR